MTAIRAKCEELHLHLVSGPLPLAYRTERDNDNVWYCKLFFQVIPEREQPQLKRKDFPHNFGYSLSRNSKIEILCIPCDAFAVHFFENVDQPDDNGLLTLQLAQVYDQFSDAFYLWMTAEENITVPTVTETLDDDIGVDLVNEKIVGIEILYARTKVAVFKDL